VRTGGLGSRRGSQRASRVRVGGLE